MNNNSLQESSSRGQKSKKSRWPLIFLLVLAIAAAGYLCYSKMVVGWLTTDVTIETVDIAEDGSASIGCKLNGFAGLKDDRCVIDEDTAIVELNCTWPVFGRENEFILIYEEGYFPDDVMEIVISDGHNQRVIWAKE